MATKNELLKLSIDALNGRISGEFSSQDQSQAIIDGIVELNGGSNKIDVRNFHRGTELFAYVEEVLPHIIDTGLRGDEMFMNLVDERNLAEGDMNEFYSEDKSLFLVGNISRGSQAVRRQRLNAGEKISVPTQMRAIKVYEELRRLAANRVDWNTFIERVSQSFMQDTRMRILSAFEGIATNTAGLNSTYVKSGSYDSAVLLEIIEHVEAATGKTATIFCTRAGARKLTDATVGAAESSKESIYSVGFYGKFYGTPIVTMKQAHKVGTDDFAINDNKIYVIAADDKPIKYVTEGSGLLVERQATDNADLTTEYLYAEATGVGIICNEKMGVYTISG